MPKVDDAATTTRFLITATEHTTIDNELIVFSTVHQQYFGIEGTGRLVWAALQEERRPLSREEIVELVLHDQEPTANAAALIHEAIHILMDLGVLHEA
jgi:hypothetical protein